MTLFKEETMLVHPVVIPGSGTRSWTVLGDDDVPVVPVDRFLAYLTDIGRSFGQWRQALGLDQAAEIPSASGTPVYLHARGVRGGVTISLTATVFDGGADSR